MTFSMRSSTVIAVTALLIGPSLSGCVSGVNDVSAFGFSPNPQLESSAGPLDVSDAPEVDVANLGVEDSAGESAASEELEVSDATVEAVAAATEAESAEASPATADADKALIRTSTGREAVAAYAGGRVGEGSLAGSASRGDGGQSLFQSLFARREAKTPIANAESGKGRRVVLNREGAPSDALPGVNARSLFEIGQRESADEEDAIEDASYQMASLGSGFARMSANGLAVQREGIETKCFPRELVTMLRAIERKFGSKVIVTSGYRSPTHNRRVNGAKQSQHMACKAADIVVPNANMRAVANYVRSISGRGGVGTYCHTQAIHVDTGPKRDWNWRCRRRRG